MIANSGDNIIFSIVIKYQFSTQLPIINPIWQIPLKKTKQIGQWWNNIPLDFHYYANFYQISVSKFQHK